MPVDLSRTCEAALGTQTSSEVEVDLEWKDSPDYMTSQVIFLKKLEVDLLRVRFHVWDPGIANPHYEAVLAFIAYGLA